MPRVEKVEKVEELKTLFKDATSFFITDYQGLNVPDMTALRKKLRDSQIRYLVAKNTLYRLAVKDTDIPEIDDFLKGPTAIAFTDEDPVPAAKILHDSFKDKKLPVVKAFVLRNQLQSADDLKRLAELPSREILLAQLVAAVESPFSSLMGSLDAVFNDLILSIDALADKKKEEG